MDCGAYSGNAVRHRVAHEVGTSPVAGLREIVVDGSGPVGVGDGALVCAVVDAGFRGDKRFSALGGDVIGHKPQRTEIRRRFDPAHNLLALRKRTPVEVKRHRRVFGERHGACAICIASSVPPR